MGEFAVGDVVRSIAGRDAGDPYVVVGLSDNRVLLSEGAKKTLRRPKSKNARHLVRVGRIDEGLASRILCRRSRDEDIAEFIAIFRRHNGELDQTSSKGFATDRRDSEGAGLLDG